MNNYTRGIERKKSFYFPFHTAGLAVCSALCLAVICLGLCSCSRDSSSSPYMDGDYPDMVLYDSSYRFGRPGSDVLEMKAGKITIYSGKNLTILENASFSQSDDLFGSCERAESTENTRVSLSGSVHVEKKSDSLVIDCDNLLWDDDEHVLKTDGRVHVTYDDGTSLDAIGFKAQLDRNVYEFNEIVQGVMKNEE